jgi:hypothetical protein
VKPELHDDASKRVTTHHASIIETVTVKGFHPEPSAEKATATMPPKRVMPPAGITTVGVEAQGFYSKKNFVPPPEISDHPPSRVRPLKRNLGSATNKISPRPLLAIHMTKERDHHHPTLLAIDSPMQSMFQGRCPDIHNLEPPKRQPPP